MVEKFIRSSRNVVDFASYQRPALPARLCRHCGAALLDGEREDECSGAFMAEPPRLRVAPGKYYAE